MLNNFELQNNDILYSFVIHLEGNECMILEYPYLETNLISS